MTARINWHFESLCSLVLLIFIIIQLILLTRCKQVSFCPYKTSVQAGVYSNTRTCKILHSCKKRKCYSPQANAWIPGTNVRSVHDPTYTICVKNMTQEVPFSAGNAGFQCRWSIESIHIRFQQCTSITFIDMLCDWNIYIYFVPG